MTKRADFTPGRKVPVFFDAQEIGESLREVAIDVLTVESENVLSRWFHSTHDVDLFIWTDEKSNLIKHQVSFCGQIVEWNVFDGIKTGLIVEEEHEEPGVDGSEIIHFDENPQNTAIHQALRLLEHATALAEDLRDTMIGNLTGRKQASGVDGRAFPQRLARQVKESRRPGFWGRLRKWFSGTRD